MTIWSRRESNPRPQHCELDFELLTVFQKQHHNTCFLAVFVTHGNAGKYAFLTQIAWCYGSLGSGVTSSVAPHTLSGKPVMGLPGDFACHATPCRGPCLAGRPACHAAPCRGPCSPAFLAGKPALESFPVRPDCKGYQSLAASSTRSMRLGRALTVWNSWVSRLSGSACLSGWPITYDSSSLAAARSPVFA